MQGLVSRLVLSLSLSLCVVQDAVAPATVKLLVIENIMLQPAVDVYILPHCTVHYIVERKKQVIITLHMCPVCDYPLPSQWSITPLPS